MTVSYLDLKSTSLWDERGYSGSLSRDYTPMGLESVSKTTGTDEENRVNIKPDLVESIVFRKGSSIKHINLPNDILILCEKYWVDMLKILTLLMEVSALSLNLEENFFKSFFKNPSCSLRLAFYPKIEKIKEGTEIDYFPQTRYGAHTDYTGFTILRQDENPGLEVLINNQWIPVPYIPDSYVINSGDLIQRWTNDVFKSNLHRVSKPKDANKDRLSIVFFTGPDDDSIIIPIDSLCTIENPSKYPPISAFDHLMHKLNVSN
ncbi:hypothetical protein HK099_008261, partial [Clydaea vesicula]